VTTHVEAAERHDRRDGFTMALYTSITLLGALTVTGRGASEVDVLAIVWGTTVGLALAHWFAFSFAVRLVEPAAEKAELDRHLAVVLAAAAVVAAVASVPVLVLPEDLERPGARFAAAMSIGVAAFAQSRAFGAPKARAARVAVVALLLGLLVAGLKHTLGH
jgi:VanZ family protein